MSRWDYSQKVAWILVILGAGVISFSWTIPDSYLFSIMGSVIGGIVMGTGMFYLILRRVVEQLEDLDKKDDE